LKFNPILFQNYVGLDQILASLKCNKAKEICLDLSFSSFSLLEFGSNFSLVKVPFINVYDRPSMSSCDLLVKVAEAHGGILELRDMPTCVN